MELDWAILAETARTTSNMAHIISGGVDTLFAFPEQGDRQDGDQQKYRVEFALPFRWLIDSSQLGRVYSFELRISDEEENKEAVNVRLNTFAGPSGKLPVSLPEGWPASFVNCFIVEFAPRNFGYYRANLSTEGKQLKSIPFRILRAPEYTA